MYDPSLGRWHAVDPLAEKYFSLTPYNYCANNPLLFTDPNGEDIYFYIWENDGDGNFERKQVQFNQLDSKLQKALEGFAKTDAGFNFLKGFAKKGDKVGSVEFAETGEFAKHDMEIAQFDSYGSAYGTSSFREGNDNMIFDLKVNVSRDTEDENAESMAITTGHEAFIHMDQYKKKLINAYDNNDQTTVGQIRANHKRNAADRNGGPDHDGYIQGNKKYSRMRTFISQLRNILNPTLVDKKIKSHDKKYKK